MRYIEEDTNPTAPISGEAFERIPQGIYDVIVMQMKEGQVKSGKNAGQDKIMVGMRIQNGKFAGRWIWDNSVMQWKVKSFILSTGAKLPMSGSILNLYEYEGRNAKVSVTWKTGKDGREYDNITWLSDDEPLKRYPQKSWAQKKAIEKSTPAPEPADDEIEPDEVPF